MNLTNVKIVKRSVGSYFIILKDEKQINIKKFLKQ